MNRKIERHQPDISGIDYNYYIQYGRREQAREVRAAFASLFASIRRLWNNQAQTLAAPARSADAGCRS